MSAFVWHFTRPEADVEYDETAGLIVIARDRDEALRLIAESVVAVGVTGCGTEGAEPWSSARCERIGVADDPRLRIVMRDYRAG